MRNPGFYNPTQHRGRDGWSSCTLEMPSLGIEQDSHLWFTSTIAMKNQSPEGATVTCVTRHGK